MYIPKHFEENRVSVLQELIQTNPLGTIVTLENGQISANYIPFIIDSSVGELGTLMCHVAKANPIWKSFSGDVEPLVIFHGSNAYISPSWYSSKHEHGKVVPTWDYMVVHARGKPQIIENRDWLYSHVSQLSEVNEAANEAPWQVSDAPAEFIDKMLNGIVGIEIPITQLVGKWKVSQNRSHSDRAGVIAGLEDRGDGAISLANAIQKTNP